MMYLIMLATLIVAMVSLYFAYKDVWLAGFGAALYVLMPYRIYVCFDLRNLSQALFWMGLPPLMLFLVKLYSDKKSRLNLLWMIPAIMIIALLSRTDANLMVILVLILLLLAVILRKVLYLPVAILGLAGSVVCNTNYWRFILLGHENVYSVEASAIAGRGYYFGYYFMSWVYADGRPGIGFGLLFSFILILWHFLTNKEKKADGIVVASLILGGMAFHWGLWDVAERVHPILLRFVSSLGTPGVMFGFACALLCIPAARALADFTRGKIEIHNTDKPLKIELRPAAEKNKAIIAKLIPAFIVGINLIAAIYQIVFAQL